MTVQSQAAPQFPVVAAHPDGHIRAHNVTNPAATPGIVAAACATPPHIGAQTAPHPHTRDLIPRWRHLVAAVSPCPGCPRHAPNALGAACLAALGFTTVAGGGELPELVCGPVAFGYQIDARADFAVGVCEPVWAPTLVRQLENVRDRQVTQQ